MKYSLDFKPRFMIVMSSTKEDKKSIRIDLCFYDYSKHHDIKCYERDGKEVSEETVEHIFDKYYSANVNPTYRIKFENDPEIGDVWVCRCIDSNGIAFFIGYSEFSATHAIEDCENAKNIILQRYWKPKKEE